MRKVIYAMSVSLDGFIEDANGDLSWSFPDEELHQHFNEQEAQIDVHLYGRRLYENMSAFWPTADKDPSATEAEIEYAHIWKEMRKIVFSTTLTEVGWNSELFKGDIVEEINKLKAQPGKDISVGGANLAGNFMRLGLIDEYRMYIHPVILGNGKRIFPSLDNTISLKLIEARRFSSGVVLLRLANKDAF
jgi:dihydrofolate reductase